MKKYRYLRKEEKDEFMALACLLGTIESMVESIQKYKGDEKTLIRNLKTGLTYTRKGMAEMVEAMDAGIMAEIKKYISKKQVFVADPSDFNRIKSVTKSEESEVTIEKHIFEDMVLQIKNDHCKMCDGNKPECTYKKMMMLSEVEGQVIYENCPFQVNNQ